MVGLLHYPRAATALLCALSGTSAFAQTPASASEPVSEQADAAPNNEEIVVTGARLREEAAQDVPVSISVLNQQSLQDLHARDITALTAVTPNLVISEQATNPGVGVIFIRGFGAVTGDVSVEPGVALYVDGIYQPTIGTSLANLFDVDRVEVLRGPQSTLLGKNASAGAVLLTRPRPRLNQTSGSAEVEYGSYDLFQVQGTINVPIVTDLLAARIYSVYRRRGNYVENLFPGQPGGGGEESTTFRGALLLRPSNSFELYLTGDYRHDDNSQILGRTISPPGGLQCASFGFCDNYLNRRRVANVNYADGVSADDFSVTAHAKWNLGPAQISSVTGYRHRESITNIDTDYGPFPIFESVNANEDIRFRSQELRINSVEGAGLDLAGRLFWVIGAFYGHLTAQQEQPYRRQNSAITPVFNTYQAQISDRKTYALFGQADFRLTDALTLSFGARRSRDEVAHDFNLAINVPSITDTLPLIYDQSRSDSNTSFEGGARYQLDETKMVYFRYAEGYRGGGFIGRPGTLEQSVGGYGPETSAAYEVGLKTEFFDRRLMFNLSLFTVNFNDLQRQAVTPFGTGFVTVTGNVARARTRGFEVETALRPMRGLNIRGTLGYLDARYLNYEVNGVDLTATPFQFAPEWTASFVPSYETRIARSGALFDTLRLQASLKYQSSAYMSTIFRSEFLQDGYATLGAQIGLGGDRFSVTFYVQNLTDTDFITFGSAIGTAPTAIWVNDTIGRVFGLSARFDF